MKNKIWKDGWKKIITDSSLRSKLVWIYFVLIILPLGFFSFYAIRRLNELTREQTLSSIQKAFNNTSASVEDELNRLEGVLDILTMDSIIYRVSSYDTSDYTYMQRLEDSNQLATTFDHLKTLSGVSGIRLYVKNDYLYSNQQRDIIPDSEVKDSRWYQQLGEALSSSWYYPGDFEEPPESGHECFSAMRVIYNPRDIRQPLAVLRVDTQAQRLRQLISQPESTENGIFLLLREKEVLLSSSDTITPGSRIPETAAAVIGQEQNPGPNSWISLLAQNENSYLLYRSLPVEGWYMAVLLPYEDVYRLSRTLRLEMLMVVFIVGLLSYGIALAISRTTLSRLSLLAQTMHAVEQGDVTARITPVGKDEIGQLMGSFSRMMERIDGLLEEKVAYGREIKNLELKALQAQINPHFLYNSLDLISCTAIVHNVPEITRLVNALARFYKLSLSKGKEVISLGDELMHARLYIQIQNMRFDDRIHVVWNIDEELLDCQIIKIVLQPIIENAIIHGIFEKKEKTGTLSVTVCRCGECIRIVVSDDGIGMSPSSDRENFADTGPGGISQTTGGYGIRNINDRLHLAYGASYGLSCESTPGVGTTVTLLIPVVRPAPEDDGTAGDTK